MRKIVCVKALRSPFRGFEPCALHFVSMAPLGLGVDLLMPRSELAALRGSCSHSGKHNRSQVCVDMARRGPARRPAGPFQPLACFYLTSRSCSWGPAGRKSRRVQNLQHSAWRTTAHPAPVRPLKHRLGTRAQTDRMLTTSHVGHGGADAGSNVTAHGWHGGHGNHACYVSSTCIK